jgi:hypothetical protein
MAADGAADHPSMLAVVPALGLPADPVPVAFDPLSGIRRFNLASAKPTVERTKYGPTFVNGAGVL